MLNKTGKLLGADESDATGNKHRQQGFSLKLLASVKKEMSNKSQIKQINTDAPFLWYKDSALGCLRARRWSFVYCFDFFFVVFMYLHIDEGNQKRLIFLFNLVVPALKINAWLRRRVWITKVPWLRYLISFTSLRGNVLKELKTKFSLLGSSKNTLLVVSWHLEYKAIDWYHHCLIFRFLSGLIYQM